MANDSYQSSSWNSRWPPEVATWQNRDSTHDWWADQEVATWQNRDSTHDWWADQGWQSHRDSTAQNRWEDHDADSTQTWWADHDADSTHDWWADQGWHHQNRWADHDVDSTHNWWPDETTRENNGDPTHSWWADQNQTWHRNHHTDNDPDSTDSSNELANQREAGQQSSGRAYQHNNTTFQRDDPVSHRNPTQQADENQDSRSSTHPTGWAETDSDTRRGYAYGDGSGSWGGQLAYEFYNRPWPPVDSPTHAEERADEPAGQTTSWHEGPTQAWADQSDSSSESSQINTEDPNDGWHGWWNPRTDPIPDSWLPPGSATSANQPNDQQQAAAPEARSTPEQGRGTTQAADSHAATAPEAAPPAWAGEGAEPTKANSADVFAAGAGVFCPICNKYVKGGRWQLRSHQLTSSRCAFAAGTRPVAREACRQCGRMLAAGDAWAIAQHSKHCRPERRSATPTAAAADSNSDAATAAPSNGRWQRRGRSASANRGDSEAPAANPRHGSQERNESARARPGRSYSRRRQSLSPDWNDPATYFHRDAWEMDYIPEGDTAMDPFSQWLGSSSHSHNRGRSSSNTHHQAHARREGNGESGMSHHESQTRSREPHHQSNWREDSDAWQDRQ